MGIINLLETQVANLIAAGEVVERPASAVKELMENAIDAGATRIIAEIKNGGVSLMRITDNGCGMTEEDAILCIQRHATSKIRSAADLDGIVTLGFRGEAMAAIASVSKLRIMTRTADAEMGVIVTCEAGKILSVEESGCPLGTTIIVEELFANVPARRKFLKRDASETAAVTAVIEKIALSRPDIAIKFITDGNLRFQTAGDGNLQNVIYAVLGRDFAKKTVKVHDMTEGIEVEGVIGTPDNCRGNRNYENFFINGRYVKCGTASAALEQAFSSYIPSDKFPSCVLALTINPAFVDVNVHPQKLEVKFSNDKSIFNAVYCAVRNALMNRIDRPTAPSVSETTKLTGDGYKLYQDVLSMKTSEEEAARIADDKDALTHKYEQIAIPGEVREASVSFPVPSAAGSYTPPSFPKESASTIPDPQRAASITETVTPSRPIVTSVPVEPTITVANEPAAAMPPVPPLREEASFMTAVEPAPIKEADTESVTASLPWFRVAGVAFNCYVFVEMEDKMLVIDKHAAHERVLFERMRDNMKSLQPVSQILLFSLELHLTPEEYAAACEYREELFKVGFDFTEGEGSNIAALLQYPSGLNDSQAEAMFVELVSRLASGTGDIETGREQIYEKALYQASCKAAVKAGREDSPENIRWIAEQVIGNPRIRYCPHGRPVAFEMTKGQFERQFERT